MNLFNIKRTMYHDQGRFILEIHPGLLLGDINKFHQYLRGKCDHLPRCQKAFVKISALILGKTTQGTKNKNILSQHDIDCTCGQLVVKICYVL